MNFIKVSVEEKESIKRPYTKVYEKLMEFVNGEDDCVRVVNYTHKSAKNCVASLRASIKKYGLYSITVIQRGEKIYLVKE